MKAASYKDTCANNENLEMHGFSEMIFWAAPCGGYEIFLFLVVHGLKPVATFEGPLRGLKNDLKFVAIAAKRCYGW